MQRYIHKCFSMKGTGYVRANMHDVCIAPEVQCSWNTNQDMLLVDLHS